MSSLSKILIVISTLVIMGCSDLEKNEEVEEINKEELKEDEEVRKDKEEKKEKKKSKTPYSNDYFLKSEFTTKFNTDIDEPEHNISEEDYKKYTEIMDYLNDHYETPEEELYKDLESIYDQSSEELKNFMNATMQDAIARDFGETENEISLTESDIQENIKEFFTKNVKDSSLLNIDATDADIDILNLRSLSKGTLIYGDYEFNYLIKSEYTTDFQEVDVFQLKVNNQNIDLD